MLKPGYIDTSAASPRSLTRPGAKRAALTAKRPRRAASRVPQHREGTSLGRWLSTDPELGDWTNPQRLNRYTYLLNDPVNYVDPDGRFELPISARQQAAWDEMIGFAQSSYAQYRHLHGLVTPLPSSKEVMFNRISLSDIQVTEAAVSARNKLIGKLGRNPQSWKKGCLELFSSLGIDPNEWLDKLDSLVFRDGTTSADVIDERLFGPLHLSGAVGLYGPTVQGVFQTPTVNAFSPFLGNRVYLRPQDSYDPGTIAHETFHKFTFADPNIAERWRITSAVKQEGSVAISRHFEDKCL